MNAAPYPPRQGHELFEATRPFARENRLRSWWAVISALVPLAGLLVAAARVTDWPLRLLLSALGALLMVRSFILVHDFLHGSILRHSRVARVLLYVVGALVLVPPRSWRESHNFHHAHVGRIGAPGDGTAPVIITDIGAFPMLSIQEWRRTTRMQRFLYRLSRHPVTIACAYLSVFLGNICLEVVSKVSNEDHDAGELEEAAI